MSSAFPWRTTLRADHAVVNFDYEPYEGWQGQPEGRTCVQMAADVVTVMDHIGLARAHVVGISRGAATAYAVATRHAARVLSLSLLVPVAPFPGHLDVGTPSPNLDGDDELVAHLGPLLFSEAFVEQQPDRVRDFILDDPGSSVVRVPRGQEEPVPRAEVPGVPTLIVTAAQDQVVAPTNADALEQVVPQARRVELPGGHMALYEDPAPWAHRIRPFVAQAAREGPPS